MTSPPRRWAVVVSLAALALLAWGLLRSEDAAGDRRMGSSPPDAARSPSPVRTQDQGGPQTALVREVVETASAEGSGSPAGNPLPTPPPAAEEEFLEEVDPRELYADLIERYAGRRLALRFGRPAMPPDPVEEGNAAVFVRLLDAATEQPVAGEIDFWRIDAPATETWSRGDQHQQRLHVSVTGLQIPGLAPGTYRLFSRWARRGAAMPPAFRVTAAGRTVTCRIEMPRRFEFWWALYTADGRRIESARLRIRGFGEVSEGRKLPSWVKPRRDTLQRDGVVVLEEEEVGEGLDSFGESELRWMRAEPDGFRFGPVRESSRSEWRGLFLEAEVAGDRLKVLWEPVADDPRLVSVVFPPSLVRASVSLPDGQALPPGVGTVEVRPGVVPAARGWKAVPVAVRVRVEGYHPLAFSFRPSELPLRPRRLTVRPSGDAAK